MKTSRGREIFILYVFIYFLSSSFSLFPTPTISSLYPTFSFLSPLHPSSPSLSLSHPLSPSLLSGYYYNIMRRWQWRSHRALYQARHTLLSPRGGQHSPSAGHDQTGHPVAAGALRGLGLPSHWVHEGERAAAVPPFWHPATCR